MPGYRGANRRDVAGRRLTAGLCALFVSLGTIAAVSGPTTAAGAAADQLELVDWSTTITNSSSGFSVITQEMTIRGDRPIASNADFQAGRPSSNLSFVCYDPPGSTNTAGGGGSVFPLAEDLVRTADATRTYRRVVQGTGQWAGECKGSNLGLVDLTGDVWADFATQDDLAAAGFQRTWTVGSGFTQSVEMRLAYQENGGWAHDVTLVGFTDGPSATVSCYRAGSSQPYETVTAPTVGSPSRTAQHVCFSDVPGEHWAEVDGVRSNSVLWGVAVPPAPAEKPIIMIHGISGPMPWTGDHVDCKETWGDLEDYLTKNGFADRPLVTVKYYSGDTNCDASINDSVHATRGNLGYIDGTDNHYEDVHTADGWGHTRETPIEHLGYHFAWWLYENYSKHGIAVDVVAHSMGGLITRFALGKVQAGDSAFPQGQILVDNVVTLGTPHGGHRWTRLGSNFCNTRQCNQMDPGDYFLTNLETEAWNPQDNDGIDWTTMGSGNDEAVYPDRAVGTDNSKKKVRYVASCHKLWYEGAEFDQRWHQGLRLKHSQYMHIGSDALPSGSTWTVYLSTGGCEKPVPLRETKNQLPPVPMIARALNSTDW